MAALSARALACWIGSSRSGRLARAVGLLPGCHHPAARGAVAGRSFAGSATGRQSATAADRCAAIREPAQPCSEGASAADLEDHQMLAVVVDELGTVDGLKGR